MHTTWPPGTADGVVPTSHSLAASALPTIRARPATATRAVQAGSLVALVGGTPGQAGLPNSPLTGYASLGILVLVVLAIAWLCSLFVRLRRSEARLRAQYDGSPLATITWQRRGDDFVLIAYNQAASALTHGEVADQVGCRCGALNLARPDVLANFERCYHGRTTIQREETYRQHPSGEAKYLTITYVFAPPDLVLVHLDDVTALRAREEQNRALVEEAADAIVMTDLAGTILEVNGAALTMTGYSRAALLGRDVADIVPAVEGSVAEAVRLGQTVQTLRRLQRHDGTSGYAEVHVKRIGDDRVQGIWRDITAQHHAEMLLRQSAESFDSLFEATGDGLLIHDGGTILAANPTTAAILGYTIEEIIGRETFSFVHPDVRAATEGHALQHGTRPDETLAVHSAGYTVPVEFSGKTIRYQGRQVRLVALRDITERKEAETALRAAELRARALYNEAERQASELALLDRVRTALADPLDPPGIHDAIVAATAEIFRGTRVSLYIREGEELVRQRTTDASPARLARLPLALGIIGRVARTGLPVLLEDVTSDPAFIRARAETLSVACVPLLDAGQVVGVINAESEGTRLGQDDLRLLIAIAQHASTSLARARLYAAARATADHLAEAQRIAHLGNWEFDHSQGQVRWSDELFRIFGYAPQEFSPSIERALQATHPEDRDDVREAHEALIAVGTPYNFDTRIIHPNGDIRVIHQRAEVIDDASGQPRKRVGIVQDVTERRELEAQLRHQAFHDPLTGLPNRALFTDRLTHALARARRSDAPCAVLFLDLDRFKTINDSLGHAVGDHLLVAVAARLSAQLRAGDTLARLGGDEFAILLEDIADFAAAIVVAERLHTALAAPLVVGERELVVSASIGLALRTNNDDRPADLLRFADVALYRAKEAGRSCTEAFYPGMSAAAIERLELEHDLRQAVDRGELQLYYQPIVDLTTGHIRAVEALVRWLHPTRGLIPPGTFIPLAEETGLIIPLGRWVLAAACQQLHHWHSTYPGAAGLALSVNLSAREFRQPDLADAVAATLVATKVASHHLMLEVTETVAMEQPEVGIATLEALQALGVQLAIDDFGTGYSSLAYLQRLPVTTLKIDRSFFAVSASNRAIVRAVADLAHGLGLAVIAEGLETAMQVAWARETSCACGQGYYFASPQTPETITALWASGVRFDLPGDLRPPTSPTAPPDPAPADPPSPPPATDPALAHALASRPG